MEIEEWTFPQSNCYIIVTFICRFSLSLLLANIPLNTNSRYSAALLERDKIANAAAISITTHVEWKRHFLFDDGPVKNEQKLELRTRKIGSSNCRRGQ